MKEPIVHISQKIEDLGISDTSRLKGQQPSKMIELPEILKKELTQWGFDYGRLERGSAELNRHLTLLYDEINLPHSPSQDYRDQIQLMLGIKSPKDAEKAAIDYIYAVYVRIDKRTGTEESVLQVTFNTEKGKILSKEQIPGEMEKHIRRAEVSQKFGFNKKEADGCINSISNKSKIKR